MRPAPPGLESAELPCGPEIPTPESGLFRMQALRVDLTSLAEHFSFDRPTA